MVEGDFAALVGRLEATEEVERAGVRGLLRPAHRRRRRGREGGDVELAEHREVVVADQTKLAALGHEAGALVGLGAVADHVAEAPELADAGPLDVGQYGFERRQVRVDVAQHGQSHEETSGLS